MLFAGEEWEDIGRQRCSLGVQTVEHQRSRRSIEAYVDEQLPVVQRYRAGAHLGHRRERDKTAEVICMVAVYGRGSQQPVPAVARLGPRAGKAGTQMGLGC